MASLHADELLHIPGQVKMVCTSHCYKKGDLSRNLARIFLLNNTEEYKFHVIYSLTELGFDTSEMFCHGNIIDFYMPVAESVRSNLVNKLNVSLYPYHNLQSLITRNMRDPSYALMASLYHAEHHGAHATMTCLDHIGCANAVHKSITLPS